MLILVKRIISTRDGKRKLDCHSTLSTFSNLTKPCPNFSENLSLPTARKGGRLDRLKEEKDREKVGAKDREG